jgi:hypothetical protein
MEIDKKLNSSLLYCLRYLKNVQEEIQFSINVLSAEKNQELKYHLKDLLHTTNISTGIINSIMSEYNLSSSRLLNT